MTNLCVLCKGAGAMLFGLKLYECRYCGCSGVMVQHGPALLATKTKPPR